MRKIIKLLFVAAIYISSCGVPPHPPAPPHPAPPAHPAPPVAP